MKDLLGQPLKDRRYYTGAYPAPPGTGPAGKTCKDCANHVVVQYANRYHKCAMTESSSAATDIRVKSPACGYYRPLGAE